MELASQETIDKFIAVKEAMKAEVNAMIDENFGKIVEAYSLSLMEFQGEGKFRFPVTLGAQLTPSAGDINVSATIGFSVKHSDKSEGRTAAVAGNALPGAMPAA
jgi:hypothetical protein